MSKRCRCSVRDGGQGERALARILGDFLCVNGDLTRLSLYENEPTEVPAGLGELVDVQEM